MKKFYEKCDLKTSSKPFNFQRILCKKESEEACMLIWTNFNNFAIPHIILVACFKNLIFQSEVVVNYLQTQKGQELVFK